MPPALPSGVLVVEDDPSVRKMLEVALRREGFSVWSAAGGAAAFAVFGEHRDEIGAVVLDVQPAGELDGPGILQALRTAAPAAPLTFIFISGGTGRYTVDELLGLGAVGFLPKPLDLPRLMALLHRGRP